MKSVFSILVVLFFSTRAYSQLSESDVYLLRTELISKVNQLRDSLGLGQLQTDTTLKAAAQNQADYMARYQILTHEQTFPASKKPADRVENAGGDYWQRVGENCLYTVPQDFPLKTKALKQVAESMFLQWKNSPPHYQNMTDREYTHGDFGFTVDPKTNAIYAAQVFGTKGVKVSGQLSENGFGIQQGFKLMCNELLGSKRNFVTNMGNTLIDENGTVILRHHDITQVQRVLGGASDGLMIDLVSRDQLLCGQPSTLDISPVYDGIVLKPVYYNDLIRNNSALSEYRLVTPIAEVPEEFQDKDFSYSLIVIKDGMACAYTVPAYVPNEPYDLIYVEPRLVSTQPYVLKDTGIIFTEQVDFEFERGEIRASNQLLKPGYSGKPYAVEIVAYTSIEGDSVINEKIGKSRADYMRNYIHRYVHTDPQKVYTTIAENWDYFYFQLELAGLGSMVHLEKDSLRKFVRADSLHDWNALLFEQRKSFGVIHYLGEYNDTAMTVSRGEMNFKLALVNHDFVAANNAMYELYQRTEFCDFLFEDAVMAPLMKEPELVQNAAALMTWSFMADIYKAVEFTGYWMAHFDELSADAKFNLLILYTYTTKRLLDVWDIRSQTLAKVMHPHKVESWMLTTSNPELLLNFHIAAIQYYGLTNNGPGLEKSFSFIVSYFKKSLLSIEDEIKLCLFFNNWSRYDLTTEFLYKRIGDADFNEEAAFILAQTAYAYPYDFDEEELFRIFKRAQQFNSDRWCEWLYADFQILRNEGVKDLYCDVCQ